MNKTTWTNLIIAVFVTFACFVGSRVADAQAEPSQPPSSPSSSAHLRDVVPQNVWEVDAGYLSDLNQHPTNTGYYLIQRNGQSLASSGTPFQQDAPASAPTFPDVSKSGGDAHEFELRLEKGSAKLTGGILDAFARKSIFQVRQLGEFRGAIGINSRTDFKQTSFIGGIETPAVHLFRPLNNSFGLNLVNWTFFSILNDSQNQADVGGKDQDVGLVSYRTFVGRGFAPVVSDSENQKYKDALNNRQADETRLKEASETDSKLDLIKLKASATAIKATKPIKQRNNVDRVIVFFADDPATATINPAQWEQKAFSGLENINLPFSDQPSLETWFESTGWYQFSGSAAPHRFINLLSLNARFYLNPKQGADRWLLLRFERGTELTTPDVYKNFISLSAGFSLK